GTMLKTYVPLPTFALDATALVIDTPVRRIISFPHEDRMAMNIKKVVIGGIVAGVVMNVIDFVTNTYIFGARMKAEADAFKPGLSDQMMGGSAIVSYIVMDFVLGIALVWTYAAIRPRFGPGLRTATFAAL